MTQSHRPTCEQARQLLRSWLADLSPQLRCLISAAGVEPGRDADGPFWGARIALLPAAPVEQFPLPPPELPFRFELGVVFRTLVPEPADEDLEEPQELEDDASLSLV